MKLIFLFVFLLLPFHNCSTDHLKFSRPSEATITESLTSHEGTGEGYYGKPRVGAYTRTFPDYSCANQKLGEQGTLAVTTAIKINEDNCEAKNIDFNFNDPQIEYQPFSPDYLGVGTATYEFNTSQNTHTSTPVTETICSWRSGNDGFQIVTKVSNDLSLTSANIYIGKFNTNTNSWTSRYVVVDSVQRTDDSRQMTYQNRSIHLDVTRSPNLNLFAVGQATAMVDGVIYNYQVKCRVANRAPIEEMNTALTKYVTPTTFTTDNQEAVCANPGVLLCDNFENRALGLNDINRANFKSTGWSSPTTPYTMGVTASLAVDGSKSFEWQYAAGANDNYAPIDQQWSDQTTEVYVRYYVKFSPNYVWSPNRQDLSYIPFMNGGFSTWVDPNQKLGISHHSPLVERTSNYTTPSGQWICLEQWAKVNTNNTSADGHIKLWANDNLVLDAPNITMTDAVRPVVLFFSPQRKCLGACNSLPANYHPDQSVAIDNVVVSKQRIGCF